MVTRRTAHRAFFRLLRLLAPDHTILTPAQRATFPFASSAPTAGWDFLVCDPTLAPVVAFDFNNSNSGRTDQNDPDHIPTVRVPIQRSYERNDVRRLIFPFVHGLGPVC